MNTFKAGTRVRVTPEYAKSDYDSDGSIERTVGSEGIVIESQSSLTAYVDVRLDGELITFLFLPEELEAV